MTPYTFTELQDNLQLFLFHVAHVSQSYSIAFKIMYHTGCRFSELRSISRFSFTALNQIQLTPLKNSNNRIFSTENIPTEFLNFITTQNNYFQMLNLSTASYYFKVYFAHKAVYHNTKLLTTHLFRHHFAKSLKNQGLSDQEIQQVLGEKDIRNSNNYIYSALTYE